MEHTTYQQNQWVQHIRMRPAMYIGSLRTGGFKQILEYLFEKLLEYKSEAPVFEIGFYPANRVTVRILQTDTKQLSLVIPELDKTDIPNYQLALWTLISLSSDLFLTIHNVSATIVLSAKQGNYQWTSSPAQTEENSIDIDFTIDKEIFKELRIVYDQVNPFLQQFAYLNSNLKIVSEDYSCTEYQRNVFYYPKGIFQQLDFSLSQIDYWYRSNFRLDIEVSLNEYHYRIGLYTPNPWFKDTPNKTFAGNIETFWGGALEEGILKGVLLALKTLGKQKQVRIHTDKKTIKTHFAFMAAVSGKEFEYEGSSKRKLGGAHIKKDVSEIVHEHLVGYYQLNPKAATDMLQHFYIHEDDESQ